MSSDLILAKSIDLAKHELKNARMHERATDPTGLTSADKGLMWFNTTDGYTKYWNGTAVVVGGAPANLSGYYTELDGRYATDTEMATAISTAINNLIASAPGTLNTLDEIAAALGDDPNFATTIITLLNAKQSLSEKNQNNGYAGLNSSGKVPVDRQGTGTPQAGRYVDGGTGQWTNLPSGSGGHTIQDEGVVLTQRAALNFVGGSVSVSDDAANSATKVTISGGGGSGGSMSYATMYKLAAV